MPVGAADPVHGHARELLHHCHVRISRESIVLDRIPGITYQTGISIGSIVTTLDQAAASAAVLLICEAVRIRLEDG